MANEEALLELVHVIEAAEARGEWNQNHWAKKTDCGTTFCAAGWKAVMDGHKLNWVSDFGSTTAAFIAEGPHKNELVATYAMQALDLTDGQAHELFYNTGNDFDELVDTVKAIISGEIE